jgi:hypothetical protein
MLISDLAFAPGTATVTEVSDAGAVTYPVRQAHRFDEFAERLGRLLDVPSRVYEDVVPQPGRGTVLIARPDVLDLLIEEHPGQAAWPWVVVVGAVRPELFRLSEAHELAATVDSRVYADWLHGSTAEPALVGDRAAAPGMDASVTPDLMFRKSRYAHLKVPGNKDLVELLALYLRVYAELL